MANPAPSDAIHVDLKVSGTNIDTAEDLRTDSEPIPSVTTKSHSRFPPLTPDWNNLKILHRNFHHESTSSNTQTRPMPSPMTSLNRECFQALYSAQFGLKLGLAGVDKVKWSGRGPGESYRDKKLSQRFGNWTLPVDDLFVDYEYPQDNGNRTGVQWVEFLGDSSTSSSEGANNRLLRAQVDAI
ncbi:hypothetical protein Sste5346_009439 [Sporothrix stenoceras]|uniref:beta-galactosidase n=1 Tax=Sporothrix stenoceras TaxID=5173 RepID=A0ABR3YKA2_9PEZI